MNTQTHVRKLQNHTYCRILFILVLGTVVDIKETKEEVVQNVKKEVNTMNRHCVEYHDFVFSRW